MKVKMLKTGEVLDVTYFRAVLLVEQGKAVVVKPTAAKSTKKETAKKTGDA